MGYLWKEPRQVVDVDAGGRADVQHRRRLRVREREMDSYLFAVSKQELDLHHQVLPIPPVDGGFYLWIRTDDE